MAKSTSKKDTKSVKKAEAPATKPLAVKEGRVTKASQTPKAKSKETAKAVAAKAGKKSKKAKEPTPESSSESESESESEASSSSDSSDSESEVKTKKTTKAKASSSDSDSSSESSSDSEAETKPAPKANGIKAEKSSSSSDSDDSSDSDEEEKPAAAKKDDSDSSESSDSDSDSDSEEAPKAKKAEKSSSDSDSESGSDSDSDDSESDSSDESEEKSEAEAPSKKRKAEADAEPVTKKSKTEGASEDGPKSLFVGNLSWNIDEEWLSREFDGFGEIIGCRIVTDKATGRSKGFGYVDFATHEAAKKAKEAKHNQELDGRALNLDFSTPRQNNGNNQDRSQQRADRFGDKTSPPSDTLFVGNISFDATNDMIGEAFGEYGTITRVSLPTDPDSGNPKGFGYVGFSSVDEAKAAFEALQGADIAGRAVRLDYAQPRSNDGGSRGGRGGGRGGARGGRGGGGRGGPRGGARGGRGGFSTNRGGFGDFQGKKITF